MGTRDADDAVLQILQRQECVTVRCTMLEYLVDRNVMCYGM